MQNVKNGKSNSTEFVDVPEENVKIVSFKIEGMTPLIMHKFSSKIIKQLEENKMGKGKKGREVCNPEQEYLDSLHVCHDGSIGFPASGFMQAMVRAGKLLGHKMTDSKSSFFVIADDPINQYVKINGEHQMRKDWVRVSNGGPDVRYRPVFNEWSAEIKIRFNPNFISMNQLATMLRTAGAFVGIGDWRPSSGRPGSFGTFKIV